MIVPVLYATDRQPIKGLTHDAWRDQLRGRGSDFAYYGDDHGETHHGVATVSVPEAVHQPGELERPRWYEKESLLRHVTLRGLKPITAEQMTNLIGRMGTDGRAAFVFIHGYNVAFNDAVMRTAQISYDFNFPGAPILYSWPSSGALDNYNRDAESIDLAIDSLHAFLDQVVLKSGVEKIHLVAHSMGNRLLLRALRKFEEQKRGPLFGEIIFAAPDVPQDEFTPRVAQSVAGLARRLSLYASSRDRALAVSEAINKRARLGSSGANLYLAEGIDTIDASGVDTDMLAHSYFANAAPVVRDLAALLRFGVPPGNARRPLVALQRDTKPYWQVGKQVE